MTPTYLVKLTLGRRTYSAQVREYRESAAIAHAKRCAGQDTRRGGWAVESCRPFTPES